MTRVAWLTLESYRFGFATIETDTTIEIMYYSALFVSATTSTLATVLIAYRIYSATRDTSQSRGRYRHIAHILVQSCGIYSFLSLVTAIQGLVTLYRSKTSGFTSFAAGSYLGVLTFFSTVYFDFSRMTVITEILPQN